MPDAYSPRVVFTNPSANSMVDPATTVEVGFDVDVAGVSNATFTVTLTSTTTPVIGAVSYDALTHRATFMRGNGLPPNAELLVELTEDILDPASNRPLMPTAYTFRTGPDTSPPMVIATAPASGSTDVVLIAVVAFTFSEDVLGADVTGVSVFDGATQLAGMVVYNSGNRTAFFTPQDQLLPNHLYTGRVATSVTDLAGNPLATTFTMTFTTGADTFIPQVKQTMPAFGDTNVPVNTNIVVRFNEAVVGVAPTSFQFNGSAVAGTLTMSSDNKTATFDPAADLPAATAITVGILPAGITDLAGNPLSGTSFIFMTL
jgi:hypothetical protein